MPLVHDDVTRRILSAALKVHTALGAGLLESAYQACLHHQFTNDGLHFEHQVRLPIVYQNIQLEAAYRVDFIVDKCVIVELKAVEKLQSLHTAQLLSYLKLSGLRVGLLINFNVLHLRQGIRRLVNGYESGVPSASSMSSVVESLAIDDATRNR